MAVSVPASARMIVQQFLNTYGLGGLINWAWGEYVKLGGGTGAIDTINFEMPNQQAFKNRFPAYAVLAKQGDVMSPAEMIGYEKSVRGMLVSAGAPAELTSNTYIQGLLAKNISASEVSSRVAMAQAAATSSHESVDALTRLYGVNASHLTSFFLDPDVMLPKLQSMWTSGQIAGEAQTSGFGALSRQEAEGLAAHGVSDSQAQSGFATLAQNAGLQAAQVAGEAPVDRATSLGLVEGLGSAQAAFQRRAATRTAAFSGAAGLNVGQGGVGGLGQNG